MKPLLMALIIIFLGGCAATKTITSPRIYEATFNQVLQVYPVPQWQSFDTVYTIPIDSVFYVGKTFGKDYYREVNYKGKPGYIVYREIAHLVPANDYTFKRPPTVEEYQRDRLWYDKYVFLMDVQSKTSPSPPSSTGASSKTTPGTAVQVKGYTRKNGTYVAPYTRSAPGTKSSGGRKN